MERSESNVV